MIWLGARQLMTRMKLYEILMNKVLSDLSEIMLRRHNLVAKSGQWCHWIEFSQRGPDEGAQI